MEEDIVLIHSSAITLHGRAALFFYLFASLTLLWSPRKYSRIQL